MAGRKWGTLVSLVLATVCSQVGLTCVVSADSTWSTVPLSVSAYTSSLTAVSCSGSSFCVAVGYTRSKHDKSLYRPLVERWNGRVWTHMPISTGENTQLSAVSCTSPLFCMIVGYGSAAHNSSGLGPFAARWNGEQWKVVGNAGGQILTSVSCVGSSFCAAVGDTYDVQESGNITFGEVWNGKSWSATPTPSPGTSTNINGVSCISPTSCVAVGVATDADQPTQYSSLALDWNGAIWSQFPSQNGPLLGGEMVLESVACLTTLSSCMAVGWYTPPGSASSDESLVEEWATTGWTIAPSPEASGGSNDFFSVSCAGSSQCVAVGGIASVGELVEAWNGSTWTVEPGGDVPGYAQNVLSGVSCTHKQCFAVGLYAANPGQPPQHALLISGT
jgi:hypothetical protein